MNRTPIDWVKNPDGTQGYTWNPITGCLNHVNGMCKGGGFPCYAYRLANGRLRERYLANKNTATKNYDEDSYPFYPRFWSERLYHAWGGEPKGIFVCDMSDLFGKGIPEEWTKKVLNLCRLHSENRYYLLTKQPQNLIKFSPFPANCRVGVTATGLQMFNKAIFHLQQIEAKVKYLSIEPFLEEIPMRSSWLTLLGQPIIQQVIIGAQTKPTIYPKDSWVQEIEQACNKASIPVFEKNNLYPAGFRHLLRQEMPEGR